MKLEKTLISRFIVDLFYPNRCPCCDCFINWKDNLCKSCMDKLEIINHEICSRCGKAPCVCDGGISFDKVYACYYYGGTATEGIISLKKGNNLNYGIHVGEQLAKLLQDNEDLHKVDFIVPVPMSKKKIKQRGYNQAEIIARIISEKTGIPYNSKILTREHTDIEQHSLSAEERKMNTSQYNINDVDLSNMRILLCDDVLTTGSTVNRCSELLKARGADTVIILVGTTTKTQDLKCRREK